MKEVNPESWHWKLATEYDRSLWYRRNISLCKYFWLVVGRFLQWFAQNVLWSKTLKPLVISALVVYCYIVPVYITLNTLPKYIDGFLFFMGFIGMFELVITAAVVLIVLPIHLMDEYYLFERAKDTLDTALSSEPVKLFKDYLRARKQKICPLLKLPEQN